MAVDRDLTIDEMQCGHRQVVAKRESASDSGASMKLPSESASIYTAAGERFIFVGSCEVVIIHSNGVGKQTVHAGMKALYDYRRTRGADLEAIRRIDLERGQAFSCEGLRNKARCNYRQSKGHLRHRAGGRMTAEHALRGENGLAKLRSNRVRIVLHHDESNLGGCKLMWPVAFVGKSPAADIDANLCDRTRSILHSAICSVILIRFRRWPAAAGTAFHSIAKFAQLWAIKITSILRWYSHANVRMRSQHTGVGGTLHKAHGIGTSQAPAERRYVHGRVLWNDYQTSTAPSVHASDEV